MSIDAKKWVDADDQLFNGDTYQILSKESLVNIIEKFLSDSSLDAEISAIKGLALVECPVSGYIITSKESREQILKYAEFLENTRD